MFVRPRFVFTILWLLLSASPALAAETRLSVSASRRTAIAIDGVFGGFVQGSEGGQAQGVVREAVEGSRVTKSLRGQRVVPLVVELGPAMGPAVWQWITASVAGKAAPAAVTVIDYDGTGKVLRARLLRRAVLTRFTTAALDGANRSLPRYSIEIAAESVSYAPGKLPAVQAGSRDQVLASNYRVTISGLPTARVGHVGEVSWSRTSGGLMRVSDLSLDISIGDRDAWFEWFDAAVLQGKSGERNVSVELLSGDLKTVMLSLRFQGAGIVALDDVVAADGSVSVFRADLYVEGLVVQPR